MPASWAKALRPTIALLGWGPKVMMEVSSSLAEKRYSVWTPVWYGARVDDLVGGFFLEVAILVDAGLVGEGVATHDRLIGLGPGGDDGGQQLAGREQGVGWG